MVSESDDVSVGVVAAEGGSRARLADGAGIGARVDSRTRGDERDEHDAS